MTQGSPGILDAISPFLHGFGMLSAIPLDIDFLLAPILHTALDAVVVMTPEGWIVGYNESAEAIFGWTKQQAIGHGVVDLIVPERYRSGDRLWLERLSAGGELDFLNRRLEIMLLHRDGHELPVELSITTAPSASGSVFLAFIRDITKERQAKAQIEQQALQNRLMYEIASMASESDSFDAALRKAIAAICEITDWQVGHAFLVRNGDTSTLSSSDIWVEEEPGLADSVRAVTEPIAFEPDIGLPGRILQTGEPLWISDTNAAPIFFSGARQWFRGAFGFPLKYDGQIIAILEFFCRSSAAPDFDTLMTVRAVGEQVGRVFERNRTHDRNAIYENAPGFIAIGDGPNHRFTFANRSYEKFVNCRNLVGKTVAEALPDVAAQGFVEILDQVYNTGIPYVGKEIEFTFVGDGAGLSQRRYADFVYQPVRSREGAITGLFCEGFDVTERVVSRISMEELQREVIHLSRTNAMATMAATLAHELNQPLTSIANYSEAGRRYLCEADERGGQQAAEALATIADLALRTGELIRNVRDLTARRQGQKIDFDLSLAIAESVQLVKASAGIDLEIVDRTAPAIGVFADRIQVQQVLINLLRNACESGLEERPLLVEISAVVNDDAVEVTIDDTGSGVSAELADSLFALNQSSKIDGMGIGLSVSRTIIESNGGKIWLEETGPTGSKFCFTLPRTEPPRTRPQLRGF